MGAHDVDGHGYRRIQAWGQAAGGPRHRRRRDDLLCPEGVAHHGQSRARQPTSGRHGALTSISQVGESLVNHLASNPPAPGAPSSERQASLDAAIQAKIRSEVSRLRAREAEIREQIERALEKENLDKESGADSGEGKVGGVSHSATLMRDLEELETRMVKITKKDTPAWHALGREREELVQCFRNNKTTPLNCQEAAQAFKATVANVEKEFVQSIHA